jgi:formate hydrogenlyase subunit 6/NADH:ubiquinone oxidoreductase subunit I
VAYRITDKCVGCSICKKICPTGCIDGEPKKRYRIQAGRCIDCGACGRVCPHEAILDEADNPTRRVRFRRTWERPVIDNGLCMACRICIDACPVQCLEVAITEDTLDISAYPALVRFRDCIGCALCAVECPVEAIRMVSPTKNASQKSYMSR